MAEKTINYIKLPDGETYRVGGGLGLPLFHNFYSKEDMATTGAYYNASLGEFLSGNIYTTAYNELVNKLGTGNVKANTDTYTDYDFVVNQDNMTFRLPLLNGSEDLPDYSNGQTIDSGFVAPCNGIFKFTNTALSSKQAYVYINNVEVSYVSGGTTIQDPSSVLIQVKANDVITFTNPASSQYIKFFPMVGNGNLYYKLSNAVTNLELLDVAKVMNEAVLKSSLVEANVIVESYVNGTSGYNVYSNGYCEQWGRGTGLTTSNSIAVSFLKEYKDTNYSVFLGRLNQAGNAATNSQLCANSLTVSGFSLRSGANGGNASNASSYTWKACGYIK